MTNAQEWVLSIEVSGQTRRFAASAMPVSIGADPGADVHLAGVSGRIQIGRLDDVFFLQPERNTRNLRVDGVLVTGSRKLLDGEVIALDSTRIACSLAGGRLALTAEIRTTAGDTSPPDLEELARKSAPASHEVAITPIAFKRGAAAQAPVATRPSNVAILVAAGFVILAAFAWFAFSAKSIEFQFEPSAEEVSLPDTLLKLRLGDRFMVLPGEHRVAAQLAGYHPFEAGIEAGPEQSKTLQFTLTKLPGLITLGTSPMVAADVQLDGRALGSTPLTDVEMTPGLHRLEFSAPRFLSEVRELAVEGGGARQELVVALTPNWAPVTLTTEPPGAEVLVDGAPAGTTPIELELEAGQRDLEVRLSGYNAWRNNVVVNAAQPQELPPVKLTQADGRIELVSAPSEASVSVDGQFLGRTPLSVRLSPGRPHQITLSKPGYEQATQQLSVAADSGRRVQVELVQQFGEIDLQSHPPNAEIWVDGKREGVTPVRLALSAVEHTIEVRQDGYAVETADVTPRPGFPQQLAFTLVALDETSGSGYPQLIRTALGQELTLVPAGQFLMGSSRREQGRRSNEVLRPIKISRAFYLGVREVSNAELRAFRTDHDSGEFAGQSLNDDDQPAVRVSWDETAQFLNWLSIQDALQPVYAEQQGTWVATKPLRSGYRLPTEAEWEWAARAAAQDPPLLYPWGAELPIPDRSGNFADVSARDILPLVLVTYSDGFRVSAPSGSFTANAAGIHDLGGNVAEWVQDYYAIDTPASSEAQLIVDPLGAETGRFRVIRGSSWRSATVTDLRLASRNYSGEGRDDLGFRVARNLE
jgi:formylglycine-generating enzyme required for sulfatase activity